MSTPFAAGTAERGIEHWAYQTQSPFRDPAEIRELSAGLTRPPDLHAWGEDEFDVEAEFEAYDELEPTTEPEAYESGFFEEDSLAADLLAEAEGSDHPLASVFSLPRLAFDAMARGAWATAIAIAIGTGQRDLNKLTNMVFWFRHPQLIGQKLRSDQVDLAREWIQVRDTIVRPTLAGRTPDPAPNPVPDRVSAGPADARSPGADGRRTMIPPDGLRWFGPKGEETPELMTFMRKVYLAHVTRSEDKKGRFVDTLPADILGTVKGKQARKDAAAKAHSMFAAAEADLENQSLSGQIHIGVNSGYRSADLQFAIWQGKNTAGRGGFPHYFQKTKAARRRLPGGEFGDAAVTMLAKTIAGNVAAPGYSNHQDGLALDLGTLKGGTNKDGLRQLYEGSWFHTWLTKNAGQFGFYQQLKNEPWHWVYDPALTSGAVSVSSETDAWTYEVVPTAVPAGGMKVPRLPVLAGHQGKGGGPDAILGWNAMPSVPAEIDVVVHLHGFSGPGKTLVNHYQTWSGLDLKPVDGATGAGRVRPTLTILPRGNNTGIKTSKGNMYKYTFPALTSRNGLQELVRESLQQFADRVGGGPPKVGRLILTAHSGGGAPLMTILRQRRDDIHEVFVFDGLYQDPSALSDWAVGRIRADRQTVEAGGAPSSAMRVFYGPSTKGYSLQLRDAVAGALRGAPDSVTARYRVESSTLGHWQIPRQYGWRLLADPAADVPDTRTPARQPQVRHEDELDPSDSPLPAETWSEWAEDEWADEDERELEGWELEESEAWAEDLTDEDEDLDYKLLDEDEELQEKEPEEYESELNAAYEEQTADDELELNLIGEAEDVLTGGDALHLQGETEAELPFLEPVRVAMAIAGGLRDEKALTNGVFFARHPELGGRAIAASEKALAAEWLDIRDRLVRPLLARTGAPTVSTATGTGPGIAGVPAGPFGTLTLNAPGRRYFRYQFTAEDALWTAKLVTLEAGGQRDACNAAVIWAMFNRYALHRNDKSFTEFIRKYSTTLQPVLNNWQAAKRHQDNPDFVPSGGTYMDPKARPGILKGQLQRHLDYQARPWSRLSEDARALALDALQGKVRNPDIGAASEFESTEIYWMDALKRSRPNDKRRKPTELEWRNYTKKVAAKKKLVWIGDVPGLNQRRNAFFVRPADSNLPVGAVSVIP